MHLFKWTDLLFKESPFFTLSSIGTYRARILAFLPSAFQYQPLEHELEKGTRFVNRNSVARPQVRRVEGQTVGIMLAGYLTENKEEAKVKGVALCYVTTKYHTFLS